jgi:integrase
MGELMPRPATGQILEPGKGGRKTWALRVPYKGERVYVHLGTEAEGWHRERAEQARRDTMDAIRLGVWEPPQKEPAAGAESGGEQTFLSFASEWFDKERHGWADRTVKDYKDTLELHVLPFFGEVPLSGITIELVDDFRAAKLKEGKLAPAQVNKGIKRLSQVLELAVEYGRIPFNPAKGKRRKAKEPPVQRTWVEPEQALLLFEQASPHMRPVIATLIGSGLRVGELVKLDWRDVSLATGTIKVGKAKTDAGAFREIDLPAGLVQELTEWKMRSEPLLAEWQRKHPGESPVFLTKHPRWGLRRQSEANVSNRLKTAIRSANKRLADLSIESISERVSPHSLRRTYASIRAALRDDPLYVSEQMGHKDVRFTLNVYSKAVKRRAKLSGAHLAEFDRALAWAELPTSEKARKGTKPAEGDGDGQRVSLETAL